MSVGKDLLKKSFGEDDEFVSCHKCKILFENNEKQALSECFKRCHSFCPPCIQSLLASSEANKEDFDCPLCKLTETAVSEMFEKKQYDDLFNMCSLQLKHQIDQINSTCDHTLIYCHQIQSAHQVILAWVNWLLVEINQLDSSNNATIAQLKSFKVSEGLHVKGEEYLQSFINKINELIIQFKDRFQNVEATKLKVSQQFHTYCCSHPRFTSSSQMSTVGSDELTKLFSTSMNHTNDSCINVLAFLISFLGPSENMTKEGEQDWNDVDKAGMRRTWEFLKRRRSEEDPGTTTHVRKKAREDQSEAGNNLSSNLLRNGDSLNKFDNRSSEERNVMSKVAEKNKIVQNRIARLEADLEVLSKQVQRAKESEANANQQTLIQIECAKIAQKKYEQQLHLNSADVEELKTVCEQLVESQKAEIEKLRREKELFEKQLEKEQIELKNMKKFREKIVNQFMKTSTEFMKTKTKLMEEVRVAKEETEQLKSKLAETTRKHVDQLNQFRNDYHAQLDKVEIEYDKLVRENEQCCAYLAASQAETIKAQRLVEIKVELEKAKKKIEKHEMHKNKPLLPANKQPNASESDQPHPSAQNVILTLSNLKKVIQQNKMEKDNVQNKATVSKVNDSKKPLQIHNFNALVKDLLADFNKNKECDWSVYPCVNCKMQVESGFCCGECKNFQLCIMCYKTEKHHHEMEMFGFNLNRQQSLSHSTDLQEERTSKVDRRILSLDHSADCSVADCLQPFCRTMKEVIAHSVKCHAKTQIGVKGSPKYQIRCLVCRQLVGLIICHAKHCTDFECRKPYCSIVKKKIRTALLTTNNQFDPEINRPMKKTENPNLEVLGSRIQNRMSIKAATIAPSEISRQNLSQMEIQEASSAFNIPLASVGSVGRTIKKPNPATTTPEEEYLNLALQDHIALFIHALTCKEEFSQANNTGPTQYCMKMKSHLNHVRLCQEGHSCKVPHCSYSKKIIFHWRNCCLSDCPFCLGLKALNPKFVTIASSESKNADAMVLTVKPCDVVEIRQAPSRPSSFQPFKQFNITVLKNDNFTPATPAVNVSHVARQIQGVIVNQLTYPTGNARCWPRIQEIDKRDVKPLPSNVSHPISSSVIHQPPVRNLPSQNIKVDSGIEVKQVVRAEGAKTDVTKMIEQKETEMDPQQPLTKKAEHMSLAIAMGGGICSPVGAISRKSLIKLLLDSGTFGSNFRTTIKELLMDLQSKRVTKESRQRIANFFGVHYLFVCSFFRKQCQNNGL